MMPLLVRLAHLLKLKCCLAKGALVTTQPAAPPILNWGHPTFHESPSRFFLMTSITQDRFGVAELVDFEPRPSVLEYLAQAHEPVGSQSASAARLGHSRCVIDAVHLGVGALQHHEAAATPFIFAVHQYPALKGCAIAKIEHDQRQPCVRYRHAVSG